jgi:amino acid adenylation domain-containing protein
MKVATTMETVMALQGFRLSVQQRRLWSLAGGETAVSYLSRASVRIEGEVEVGSLRRAVEAAVARHESLRTTFRCLPGMAVPLQVVAEPGVDWRSGGPGADGEEPAFDLERGPLLRAALAESSGSFLLHLVCPALCADRESLALLMGEIAALYGAGRDGEEPPGAAMQYADISEWQNEVLESTDTEAAREPWRKLDLSATAGLRLPGGPGTAGPFAPASVPVGPLPGAELDRLGRDLGAGGEEVLLAAWWALLSRLTGRSDLALGVVADGRGYEELAGVVGALAKVLPMTCRVEGFRRFPELVQDVRSAVAAALQGQEFFAWDQLAQPAAASGDEAPILPFCFERSESPAPRQAGGALFSLAACDSQGDRFQVKLRCWRRDGELAAALDHDRGALDDASAGRFAGALLELLDAVAARPDLTVDDLPSLAGVDRRRLLTGLNDTRSDLPADGLHRLFEAQAGRTPDRVAVVAAEGTLTYADLDARASRLADLLSGLGVGPEVIVAIHLDRSLEMVVGILGVLKAGGAYLPLDPEYPRDRRALMLADARPALLLTHSRWVDDLPEAGLRILLLDRDHPAPLAGAPAGGGEANDPRHPAYVIYTSGSTGRPKGVVVSHGAIANRLLWMQRDFPLAADDRVLQKTPFSFDASIWEIFLPLLTGAELVLVRPGAHRDSAHLIAEIVARGITVLQLVPSQLRVFLEEEGVERCRSLRRVFCGGEALPLELQHRFFSKLGADLHILYGPTEASIDVTFWSCRRGDEQPLVRIGRPIANTRIRLLDAALRLSPEGWEGELFASGAGLARGYLGRPDLTAERFLPDPFGEPGERMYRTGDLARWLEDGSLAFLGRADHQVKVRGFRIELGEIEAVLAELPEVRTAVVIVAGGAPAGRLTAFVVAEPDQRISVPAVREHLRSKLPEHMIPAAVSVLERLPLTPNGKLDRAALTVLEVETPETAGVSPRTPVEEMLTGVFAELLGRERVGAADDFFELGGHSLLATQVISRLRQVFRVDLPLRSLFQAPTAAGLAALVEQARQKDGETRFPPLGPMPREQDPPLSYAQQRLWFLERLTPGGSAFNIPTAVLLSGELDLGILERSFGEIAARHEALRTVVGGEAEPPVQRVLPPAPVRIPQVDLAGLPPALREAESGRLAAAEARRPFDLARGPLVRLTTLRLEEREHVVLLTLHHIVADGGSTRVLVRELATLYGAFAAGEPSPLPPLPFQYGDFAEWQRRWMSGAALEREIAYWRAQLAGAPPRLDLPADLARPPVPSGRGAQQTARLPEELVAALAALGRREGVTLFMVLVAAFQVLLHWRTRQDDLVVGTDVASRNRVELESLIGFFVNQLALRTDLSGDPTFGELLARVREVALAAYAHQDLPFDKLVDALNPERSLSHAPIFQVKINYQDDPARDLVLPRLTWRPLPVETGRAQLDLILNLIRDREGIEAVIEYSTDLFASETIERYLECYRDLLELAAGAAGARLSELETQLAGRDQERRLGQQRERNAALRQGLSRGMRRSVSAVAG